LPLPESLHTWQGLKDPSHLPQQIEPIETTTGSDKNLCMIENLPSPPKKRPAMPGAGRPKGSVTIADHSLRLQMATEAVRLYPKVIAFWNEVLENEKKNYTTAERLEASARIMAYGFGKPPQAIEAHFREQRHQILEIRWLPPDPNDRSKLIEPEPD
jgi:hypothetical protein